MLTAAGTGRDWRRTPAAVDGEARAAQVDHHRQEDPDHREGDQAGPAPGVPPPVARLPGDQRAEPVPPGPADRPREELGDRAAGRARAGRAAGPALAAPTMADSSDRGPPPQQRDDRRRRDQQLHRRGPGPALGHVDAGRPGRAERGPADHLGHPGEPVPVGVPRGGEHRASCSGPSSAASTASSTAARSRTRRDRSAVANALVTARLAATQSSSPATTPTSGDQRRPTSRRAAPAVTTRPEVASSVAIAGHADQRRGEQPGDQRAAGQRQQREPGRVERLVDAEEDQRQQQPAEHQQRRRRTAATIERVRGSSPARPGAAKSEEAAGGEPEPDQRADHEQRDPPGLAPEAVAHDPQLEPDEVPGRDRPGRRGGDGRSPRQPRQLLAGRRAAADHLDEDVLQRRGRRAPRRACRPA